MKTSTFLLAILAASMIFSAFKCGKDAPPAGELQLDFFATYDGDPLVFQQIYTYPDGHKIFFQRLSFYLSNVEVQDQAGEWHKVLDVEYLDFSDNTSLEEAQRPLSISIADVPVGSYQALRLGIGVDPALNNADANKLPAGNPLRDTYNANFWSDWGSFIFLKSEGIYDKDNDGMIENNGEDHPFGHHCGTNESYVTVSLAQPFEIAGSKTTSFPLQVDLLRLYDNPAGRVDLADPANLYTHNPNDLTLAKRIMAAFQYALTLK